MDPLNKRRRARVALGTALAAATLACGLAGAQTMLNQATPNDELEDLISVANLPYVNLPTPLVFGNPAGLCLPGNPACTTLPVPADAGQPNGVTLATMNVAGCPIVVKTGNVALKSWANVRNRFLPSYVSLRDFDHNELRSYAAPDVYFSTLTDLVAVPVDPIRCRALGDAFVAFDLGTLTWSGRVGAVGFGGAGRQPALTTVSAAPAAAFTLTVIGKTMHVVAGPDCTAGIVESPIYRSTGPAGGVLFPVVAPAVAGIATAPGTTNRCLPQRG